MSRRALFEPLSRWDPRTIGPYALLGRLGAGAMGRVYLGRSAAGRLVAVKTIKLEFADEADFRLRFGHEVAAARRVSGFFTAPVVAADPDAEIPWLATAYVPAPSLDRVVGECGPLPVSAVRWLAAGCAEALDSIHGVGLIHRDLKPSNVLVSLDGPRVIDFGLARAVERLQMTATQVAMGTPAYMAPEQARGVRPTIGASDVFSLGSTLVYMATGQPPFRGESAVEVMLKLTTEPPELGGLPADLEDLVLACLARDPADRPSPAELLALLAPHLGSEAGHEFDSPSLPGTVFALLDEYRVRAPQAPAGSPGATGVSDGGGSPGGGAPPALFAEGAGLGEDSAPPVRAEGAARRSRAEVSTDPEGAAPRRRNVPAIVSSAMALVLAAALAGVLAAVLFGGAGQSRRPARQGPPAPPGVPLSGVADRPTGPPRILVNQPVGDGDTVFVVHGTGWAPGSRITVGLVGRGVSRYAPVADMAGTFNYAVDQDHVFFRGPIPPGRYQVVVSARGTPTAEAAFEVHR